MLHSYTVDAATGNNSGLSALLRDTSTSLGIEPPTPIGRWTRYPLTHSLSLRWLLRHKIMYSCIHIMSPTLLQRLPCVPLLFVSRWQAMQCRQLHSGPGSVSAARLRLLVTRRLRAEEERGRGGEGGGVWVAAWGLEERQRERVVQHLWLNRTFFLFRACEEISTVWCDGYLFCPFWTWCI